MTLETYWSFSAAEERKGIFGRGNSMVRVRRLRIQKLRAQVLEPMVLPLNCYVMVGTLPPLRVSQFHLLYNGQINGPGLFLYTGSFWRIVRRHLVEVKPPHPQLLTCLQSFLPLLPPWKTLIYLSKPQLSPPGSLPCGILGHASPTLYFPLTGRLGVSVQICLL